MEDKLCLEQKLRCLSFFYTVLYYRSKIVSLWVIIRYLIKGYTEKVSLSVFYSIKVTSDLAHVRGYILLIICSMKRIYVALLLIHHYMHYGIDESIKFLWYLLQ